MRPLDRFTNGQLRRHMAAIIGIYARFDVSNGWNSQPFEEWLSEYVNDYKCDYDSVTDCKRDAFEECDLKDFDAIVDLYALIKIPARSMPFAWLLPRRLCRVAFCYNAGIQIILRQQAGLLEKER